MSCYDSETLATSTISFDWDLYESFWDSREGHSVLLELCYLINERWRALGSSSDINWTHVGINPSRNSLALLDSTTPSTKIFYDILKQADTQIKYLLQNLIDAYCIRWSWEGSIERYLPYIQDIAQFDFTKIEEWQLIIDRMREEIEWMSGRNRVSVRWLERYVTLESYYSIYAGLGLPPLPSDTIYIGGLNPSFAPYIVSYDPGSSTSAPNVFVNVDLSNSNQEWQNISFGESGSLAPGYHGLPPSPYPNYSSEGQVGIGVIGFNDTPPLSAYTQSWRDNSYTAAIQPPSDLVEFGWWKRSICHRRFFFILSNPNNIPPYDLIGRRLNWEVSVVPYQYQPYNTGYTLSQTSGTIVISLSNIFALIGGRYYIDITLTLDDTSFPADAHPNDVQYVHDDGYGILTGYSIYVNTSSKFLYCLNACGGYVYDGTV